MNKNVFIKTSLLCLLLCCCKSNSKKDTNSNESIKIGDSLVKSNVINIKIDDTLVLGKKNYGEILVTKYLQDSIKRTSNDVRGVTAYLNIYDKQNELNLKECDTFYQSSLDFIKISIPFYIIPEITGEKYLKGKIEELIILDGYKFKDSSQTRLIEFEYFFNKKVYVKKPA